jgi:tetratricopeptide (TPR) repeat protein
MVGRIANAALSYTTYLLRLCWPHNLAVFYPYPEHINRALAAGCFLFLLAVTVLVIFRARKAPWAAVGWFWYLGVLFPMIGIVQAGSQAMADRYLYVPAIGIYLIVAMAAQTVNRQRVATGFLVVLCLLNIRQTGVWANSRTLFSQALEATEGNYLAHNNYGLTFRDEGDIETARHHFEASLAIRPSYAEARNNLGITLADLGEYEEAIKHLQIAAGNGTLNADALYNLGTALLNTGDPIAAEFRLRQAVAEEPGNGGIRYNLGYALMQQHRWKEAIDEYNITLQLQPGHTGAAANLRYIAQQKTDTWAIYENANLLRSNGQLEAAAAEYRHALELRPDFPEAHNNLGVTLGMHGDQTGALFHFEKAVELAPDYADARTNVERARQLNP